MPKKPDCNLSHRPSMIYVGNNDPEAKIKRYIRLSIAAKTGVAVISAMAVLASWVWTAAGAYNSDRAIIQKDIREIRESMAGIEYGMRGLTVTMQIAATRIEANKDTLAEINTRVAVIESGN